MQVVMSNGSSCSDSSGRGSSSSSSSSSSYIMNTRCIECYDRCSSGWLKCWTFQAGMVLGKNVSISPGWKWMDCLACSLTYGGICVLVPTCSLLQHQQSGISCFLPFIYPIYFNVPFSPYQLARCLWFIYAYVITALYLLTVAVWYQCPWLR